MNCTVCGAGVEAGEQQCSKCREIKSKVQILTLEEKQQFSGMTLEQDQHEEERHDQYQGSNGGQQMYSRQFSISNTSLFTKLLVGVILTGVVFIGLPIAIFLISIFCIMTYMVRK